MIESLAASVDFSRVWMAFLVSFAGGILVSFTPCIYPIIPIQLAYVSSHGGESRWRGFTLSLAYVLGTSLTYTALGLVAALTGSLFGSIQTSPWTYFIVANICILMGLAMLEVYTLPLPGFMTRTPQAEGRTGHLGALALGVASGIVLGPCTAPVLGVLLAYVATTQNVIYGMSLLFTFALGMGTLLIILGTFTGLLTSLPRAGTWMMRIQRAFGWVMLILGEYFLFLAGKFSL